jgi:hypothetical protein
VGLCTHFSGCLKEISTIKNVGNSFVNKKITVIGVGQHSSGEVQFSASVGVQVSES